MTTMRTRVAFSVRGIVQGVGFRPHVYHLATQCGLGGFVRNHPGCVWIEVEGDGEQIKRFRTLLTHNPPPGARIEYVQSVPCEPRGDTAFLIATSENQLRDDVVIAADRATCDECLRELFDPNDRRYRYPFVNCMACGPRLTIITDAPYDRSRTTMAGFPMCPACQAEYDDPTNRRFHAQPIACPECGPQVHLFDGTGQTITSPDVIKHFAEAIRQGSIGAMKGLGGFHLVCDASDDHAIQELRRRKHREEKPFAVMATDIQHVEHFCMINDAERQLMCDPRRPIVLLRKRAGVKIAESVAPGNPWLGVMLPYTPLHHLLLRELNDRPVVMTSGNRNDEPIAIDDADALARLHGIADLYLTHNRPIHVRCDDSVARIIEYSELTIRRSRGYAPLPLPLLSDCSQPILAVGGQLKGTFALGSGRRAILSHHLGDLDHIEAYRAFLHDISLYERLFAIHPTLIAHDLHPDYASTRYARARMGVKLVPVQHHHAHMAACMVEHQLRGPAIGVILDGSGFGHDGTIWGGEFLVGDLACVRRAAHFRTVGLPGGESAIREPWRMALAYQMDADCHLDMKNVSEHQRQMVFELLKRGLHCPQTSSVGRLFDAVAAMVGVRTHASYEGQAAIELEWLATKSADNGCYAFELNCEDTIVVDTRPMIQSIVRDLALGVASPTIARRFHTTVVNVIVDVCSRLRETGAPPTVVLSGGVFQNALLTRNTIDRLRTDGFAVYSHHLIPPNDAGLSLGQLAIAQATITL